MFFNGFIQCSSNMSISNLHSLYIYICMNMYYLIYYLLYTSFLMDIRYKALKQKCRKVICLTVHTECELQLTSGILVCKIPTDRLQGIQCQCAGKRSIKNLDPKEYSKLDHSFNIHLGKVNITI